MTKTFYDYGKPQGKDGEELLDLMDQGHTPVSLWALTNLEVNKDDLTLDIGCGSGLNVKRLYEKSPKAKSYGVDHSSTSVKKSIMMNRQEVDNGNIIIEEANVLDMPFDDKMYDVITAFETVYFWPDIVDSFKEVKRILKDDGQFFIVLEANGCTNPEKEDQANAEGCTFYTDEQLQDLLKEAGFTKIKIFLRNRTEDTKTIKTIINDDVTVETINETCENDDYEEELKQDEYIPSPQWMCLLIQK